MFVPYMLAWMNKLGDDGAICSDAMVEFRHFQAFLNLKARCDSRRASNYLAIYLH
jgi:hypothetical protein